MHPAPAMPFVGPDRDIELDGAISWGPAKDLDRKRYHKDHFDDH